MRKILFLCLVFPLGLSAQTGTHMEMKVTMSKGMGGTLHYYSDKSGKRLEFRIGPTIKEQTRHIITMVRADNPDTIFWMHEPSNCYSADARAKAIVPDKVKYKAEVFPDTIIAGYKCKHIGLTGVKSAYEFWTSTSLNAEEYLNIVSMDRRWGTPERFQAAVDAGATGFPVRWLQRSPNEGEIIVDLVKVEKKKIEKNLFSVPANYSLMVAPVKAPSPVKK